MRTSRSHPFWARGMTTFILNSENLSTSVKSLIDRLGPGDSAGVPDVIQICDPTGKVVAYLSSPPAHEQRLYDEAQAWAVANRATLQKRSQNQGGINDGRALRTSGNAIPRRFSRVSFSWRNSPSFGMDQCGFRNSRFTYLCEQLG